MHERTGLISGWAAAIAGAFHRFIGFAFGKAIAFTYAVIVSVVANVVFEYVREPPHIAPAASEPDAVVRRVDPADLRTPAPVSRSITTTAIAPAAAITPAAIVPAETISPGPPPKPAAETPHPGPGSGGLY